MRPNQKCCIPTCKQISNIWVGQFFSAKSLSIWKHLSPMFCMATALFPVTIIRWMHRSPSADRGVIIIRNSKRHFKGKSLSKQPHFEPSIFRFLPSHFKCVPLFACRDAALDPENWVHIPLKEISDANKLFCALCSGYRVAPKTKLCATLLTSTKFASPSWQDAPSSAGMAHPRFTSGAGRPRKKMGVTAEEHRRTSTSSSTTSTSSTEPEWESSL